MWKEHETIIHRKDNKKNTMFFIVYNPLKYAHNVYKKKKKVSEMKSISNVRTLNSNTNSQIKSQGPHQWVSRLTTILVTKIVLLKIF